MATERIDIVVRDTGASEAEKNVRGIGRAAKETGEEVTKMNAIFNQFKGLMAGLGIAGALRLLQQSADTYRDITNQLQLVTENSRELASVEQRLFDISQNTNQSFRGTVEIFAQLRQGAAQYGLTADDTIKLTETLSLALDASGKSSEEARGAIGQLAKSVAQGEVGGRALVAVFQQVPIVARAVAQSLNVPISRLNEMAASGQITGRELIKAISGSQLIADAAAAEIDTISDAWTNVRNAFVRYVGQLDQSSGIGQAVSAGLIFLAQNLSTLLNLLISAAGAWVGYRVAIFAAAVAQPIFTAAVAASSAGVSAFRLVLLACQIAVGTFVGVLQAAWLILRAHPFIFLATAIAGAITAIVTFGNSIKIFGISPLAVLQGVVTTLGQAWQQFVTFIQPVVDWLRQVWQWCVALFLEIQKDQELLNVLKTLFIALGVAIAVSLLPGLAAAAAAFILIGEAITVVNGGSLGEFTTKVINAGIALKDNFTKNVNDAQTALDGADTANKKFGAGVVDTGNQAVDTDKKLKSMGETVKGVSKEFGSAEEIHRKWQERLEKNNKVIEDSLQKLRELAAEEEKLAKTTRNAFGEMIEITDEWANRSGANFNKVKDAARSTADSINDVSSATSSMNSSAGRSGGGGGGGSQQTGTATLAFQNAEGVYDAAASARELLDKLGKAQGQTERSRALSDIYNSLSRIIFMTGNTYGLASVSRAQQDTGLMGLVQALKDAVGAKFATGGSFIAGGYGGGTDSQMFMASPGERVTVQTPGQYRNGAGVGGGGRPIVVNMNVATPDAGSFRRSETQIAMALSAKLGSASRMFT